MDTQPTTNEQRTQDIAAQLDASEDRRLHKMSWLFAMLETIKQFIVPLAIFVFLGKGGGWEIWGLAGGGFVSLWAIVQYFTYRFRIEGGEIIIRSGVISKNTRNIPISRIQNVGLKRTVIHRLFDVAEVTLESAGSGGSSEANMRVLSMADAQALEAMIEGNFNTDAVLASNTNQTSTDAPPVSRNLLLHLTPKELLRYGMISDRGLVLGGLALGFLGYADLFDPVINYVVSHVKMAHLMPLLGVTSDVKAWGWPVWLMLSVSGLLSVMVLGKLSSITLAFLSHWDFKLSDDGSRLSIEKGLLTRIKSHSPLAKVQVWRVVEGWMHRLMKRQSIHIDTAVLQAGNQSGAERGISELVPVATAKQVDGMLAQWLNGLDFSQLNWLPVHPKTGRRLVKRSMITHGLMAAILMAVLAGSGEPFWIGALWLLWLPCSVFLIRRKVANMGYALQGEYIAWKSGWISKQWVVAEINRIHALQIHYSLFDKRYGMAHLIADTVGGSTVSPRLHLKYLPEKVVAVLAQQLQKRIEKV